VLGRFCVYKGGQVYYSKNYTKQALQSKGYSRLFLVMVPQDPVLIIHLHEVTGYITQMATTQILHLFFTFNRVLSWHSSTRDFGTLSK
jgi:hypothetical protein